MTVLVGISHGDYTDPDAYFGTTGPATTGTGDATAANPKPGCQWWDVWGFATGQCVAGTDPSTGKDMPLPMPQLPKFPDMPGFPRFQWPTINVAGAAWIVFLALVVLVIASGFGRGLGERVAA